MLVPAADEGLHLLRAEVGQHAHLEAGQPGVGILIRVRPARHEDAALGKIAAELLDLLLQPDTAVLRLRHLIHAIQQEQRAAFRRQRRLDGRDAGRQVVARRIGGRRQLILNELPQALVPRQAARGVVAQDHAHRQQRGQLRSLAQAFAICFGRVQPLARQAQRHEIDQRRFAGAGVAQQHQPGILRQRRHRRQAVVASLTIVAALAAFASSGRRAFAGVISSRGGASNTSRSVKTAFSASSAVSPRPDAVLMSMEVSFRLQHASHTSRR